MEELLPIGSVVLLQDGVKKIMITGYMAVNQEDEQKIYDYSGCIYPEGLLSSDQCLLFFHNQIKEVFFEGYKGEEYQLFCHQLEEIQNRLTSKDTIETI
ncbi:MAG: DUF4176 domain-containing protein [Bacilli bacterium]|jgi:hypothetical protein|nr:DUF4176 domain-containing protein [Bacilli bacterium]